MHNAILQFKKKEIHISRVNGFLYLDMYPNYIYTGFTRDIALEMD